LFFPVMKKILIQLDTDPQPSVFDRVVAIDAGVEELFSYANVNPGNCTNLVHGAMFTRRPEDLKSTAIFIGGSDVSSGDNVLKCVRETFFGPVHVSVMMDSNGCNTTASAAVIAAARHLDLNQAHALVLGATGPVGTRVVHLLAHQGCSVHVGSRSPDRARRICDRLRDQFPHVNLIPQFTGSKDELVNACDHVDLLISSGAAGVQFLTAEQWKTVSQLKVAIDLNAVPPAGIAEIELTDKATDRAGVICYGAIGVGGTKMKIHNAAVQKLFETNDSVLNTAEIFELGQALEV